MLGKYKLILGILIVFLFFTASVEGQRVDDILSVNVSANPQAVGVDGQVRVQLALSANSISCPTTVNSAPLDVMLVIDRSSSMSGDKWDGAQQAAKSFIDQMNFDQDRVGVTLFSGSARVEQHLTNDAEAAKQTVDDGSPSGGTDIADGIEEGGDELAANERADVPRVLILLADGSGGNEDAAVREADIYRDLGIRIITIGLGDDIGADETALLRAIADSPEDYYFAPDSSKLGDIYQSIARSIQYSVGVTSIEVTQSFDNIDFELVADSISPAGNVQDNVITWQLPVLPDDDIELFSYQLKALTAGTFDVATSTQVVFTQCESEDRTIALDPGPQVIVSPPPPPLIITPDLITGLTCEQSCVEEIIRIEVPDVDSATVVNQLDVVFLMDVTSSMDEELNVVKSEVSDIMLNLRGLVADTYFAAATFADYAGFEDAEYGGGVYGASGDYPWRLDQDLTADMTHINRAINRVALLSGGDGPESYTRALYELQSLSWRPGSRRLVIMFGDAIPHDKTFFDEDTGIDPGPDITNIDDDLQLRRVVSDLSAANISIIAVNARDDELADVVRFFRYTAEETGGEYFRLDSAEQIPEAIVTLVGGQIAAINQINISTESPYSEWLQVNPGSHDNISYDGRVLESRVSICPGQTNAERGDYEFDLIVTADEEAVATVPATITYFPVCLPPVDLFIADHPGDDGTECTNLTGVPFWNSSDIVIRNRDDHERTTQDPKEGATNYVYALIHNRGYEDITDADVHMYWKKSELAHADTASWHELGNITMSVPGEGEAWTQGFAWEAPDDGSYSFLVRAESVDDPTVSEHDIACENNLAVNNQARVIMSMPSVHQGDLGGQTSLELRGNGLYDLAFDLSQLPSVSNVEVTLDRDAFAGWAGTVEGGNRDGNVIASDGSDELVLHDLFLETAVSPQIAVQLTSPSNVTSTIPVLLQQNSTDIAGLMIVTQLDPPDAPKAAPEMTPIPVVRPNNPPPSYYVPVALIVLLFTGILFLLLGRDTSE